MRFADSHCHLSLMKTPVDQVISEAACRGVDYLLCVAIDQQSCASSIALARRYPGVAASAGVHPNTAAGGDIDMQALAQQADCEEVVAIGETGLDYFRCTAPDELQRQQKGFRQHIRLARDCRKPLIIHCRDAKDDVIRILREEGAGEVGGVMHCFVEDLETARQAMALNFYISLSGIITFRNAAALREVVRQLPLERLMMETDSPYLAPAPHRGKVNQPAWVRHVAGQLAELQEVELEQLAAQTTANYLDMTGLPALESGSGGTGPEVTGPEVRV